MAYNHAILPAALKARSSSFRDLSRRLEMDEHVLRQQVSGDSEPSTKLLGEIAKELSLPRFAFYMSKPPVYGDMLVDFRSEDPAPSAKSRQTVESIQVAKSIQHFASQLGNGPPLEIPHAPPKTSAEIEKYALEVRKHLGIKLADQRDCKDAKSFYNVCRKKIEDFGVFVLHDSFPHEDGSGFCLFDERYPVIVVNTQNQSRGRRLFTLLHEFSHVLMRLSGISDPFISKNSTEARCNEFAASFLVPHDYVSELLNQVRPPEIPDLDDVAWASRRLKISQEATVLRLERLGVFRKGSHARWLGIVRDRGSNPDYADKRGGSNNGPPPQEKTKLAKYGFRFADVVGKALESGNVNPIEIYRSSGLKPAYQRPYFTYAKSIHLDRLNDLELEDD